MATNKGKTWKWKRKRWRYFYYNNRLHKVLTLQRGKDEVLAWCYQDHKRYYMSWSDVQRKGHPAITLKEAGKIINRAPQTLYNWINTGVIPKPERTYSLKTGNPGNYRLSEKDVKQLHEVLQSQHRGRPRNDGGATLFNVPNEKEVRAAMKHNLFLYAKSEDGEYIPIWESEEF